MNSIKLIEQERKRQMAEEGYDSGHDNQYDNNELIGAAICYLGESWGTVDLGKFWPWKKEFWKPRDRCRNLVRAAALIVAELDRMDRENDIV